MHRLWYLVVIGALAVAVCMVGVDPAFAAKGGNNDTAKVCQHGGWKGLVSDAGGVFVNQGDCVNDGAQGSAPFGTAGNAACSDLQGPHGFDLDATLGQWTCMYETSQSVPTNPPELRAACDTDTNGQGSLDTQQVGMGPPPDGGSIFSAICALSSA